MALLIGIGIGIFVMWSWSFSSKQPKGKKIIDAAKAGKQAFIDQLK